MMVATIRRGVQVVERVLRLLRLPLSGDEDVKLVLGKKMRVA